MYGQEYQCRRCENIFYEKVAEVDPRCPKCGSVSVEATNSTMDVLDVLRTRGAGSGGG